MSAEIEGRESDDGPPSFEDSLAEAFVLALALDPFVDIHAGMTAAIGLLEDLAQERPDRPEPSLAMAFCHAGLGRSSAAVACLDACRDLGFGGPSAPEVEFEQEGDDGERSLVTVTPALAELLRAQLECELGQTQAAKRRLEALDGRIDHDYEAHVHTLLADLAIDGSDFETATRHLGEALAWDRDFAPAHFTRGRLRQAKGDDDAALRAFERAVRLDPYEPEFRLARAMALTATGRADMAFRDLDAIDARFDAGFDNDAIAAASARLKADVAGRLSAAEAAEPPPS